MNELFKVSDEWMKACGREGQRNILSVISNNAGEVYPTVIVEDQHGKAWTVAIARGEFINIEEIKEEVSMVSTKTYEGRLARKNSAWARPGHFDKGIPQGTIYRERSVETLHTLAESNGGWEKWPTILGAMGYTTL